jgi:glycosyltransferase involved in cell wall biosynthesis
MPQPGRALVITTVGTAGTAAGLMGSASYSYYYVYEAFAPLLRRWGSVVVTDVEGLDAAVRAAAREHAHTIHVSFRPMNFFRPAADAPNVAFPFWDFPDVPDYALGGNPQNDWAGIAGGLDLVLTASEFTREAFVRSGVRVPIRVTPVPVMAEYFGVAQWEPRAIILDCDAYVLAPDVTQRRNASSRAKDIYQRRVRPHLSLRSADLAGAFGRAAAAARSEWRDITSAGLAPVSNVELPGVIYTTVLNPFDQRKNWEDLLTAFLFALRDRDDATLLIKLAVAPERATFGLNKIVRFWRRLGLSHRCRVVIITAYLADDAMTKLAAASTYYLNASRAEGACLPLQNFLAAGRPAIAPRHSAIADYFDDGCGFVVESHPEPAPWPQDPDGRCTTSWHRLVWTSLRDQIAESYRVATSDRAEYERLSANARETLQSLASADAVWARLEAALDSVVAGSGHAL